MNEQPGVVWDPINLDLTYRSRRWFDKTFNCIIFKNGRFGLNAEHSWADAPIVSYIVEEALGYEFKYTCYGDDGKCQGSPQDRPLLPEKLKWEIPEEVCLFYFVCASFSWISVKDSMCYVDC